MSEIDKFFEELHAGNNETAQSQDVFDQNTKPTGDQNTPAEGGEAVIEEGAEGRKNRRHRRLEEQLQRERESNIALNARIQTLAETRNSSQDGSASPMPAEWVALYGDTPEAKTAWAMQERMFKKAKDEAKQEAIEEFQLKQKEVADQQKQFETYIDSELEALEDQFDVDLTSDAPAARKSRREFLELVQKVSPKDQAGNVTSYADFGSTYELYKNANPKAANVTVNRAKEIAAKSMETTGQNTGTGQQHTPGFHGWKQDYGL